MRGRQIKYLNKEANKCERFKEFRLCISVGNVKLTTYVYRVALFIHNYSKTVNDSVINVFIMVAVTV